MQRKAMSTEEEREFILDAIEFTKNALCKPRRKALTDKDVCSRISGINTAQLSLCKSGKRNVTVSMKKALHKFLVAQLEVFRSMHREPAMIKRLEGIIATLSDILHTKPWHNKKLNRSELATTTSSLVPAAKRTKLSDSNSTTTAPASAEPSHLLRFSTFAPAPNCQLELAREEELDDLVNAWVP